MVRCTYCGAENLDPGTPTVVGFRCGRCGLGPLVRLPDPLPRRQRTAVGAGLGAVVGGAFGGPPGAILGAILGAALASREANR